MKVLSVANYNTYPINKSQQKKDMVSSSFSKPLKFAGSMGNLRKDLLIKALAGDNIAPLNKFKNFTIAEYLKLTPEELQELRMEYEKTFSDKIHEYYHGLAALAMKSVFDKSFGKNGYEVLSIGRSISSINKVLGYKIGEDNAKNIPMTNASRFNSSSVLRQDDADGGMDKFLEFLYSIGLNNEEMRNSGKIYILADYCVSGSSLRGAKNLFEYIFNSKATENLRTADIKTVFDSAANLPNEKIDLKEAYKTINRYLFISKYKIFSTVGKCSELANTANSVKDLSKEGKNIKLFRFKLLDNEMLNQYNTF